ncbi:AMP-binding protein [Streptomyces sp. NPDC088747]|uniref:AMP-binding protein n=1 Tax=Streptomyces sp. NPDC088747 TaxID=3365886 RepID=UPI00382FA0FF
MSSTDGSENYSVDVLNQLAARGDHEAIVHGERRISGSRVRETVLRFAAALRRAGVGPGTGVALFTVNTPETVMLKLAVHFLGGRLVFVPPEPGTRELEAYVRRADVEVLVFDPVFEERTESLLREAPLREVFALGPSTVAADWLSVSANATPLGIEDAADGRLLATMLSTGATTGPPKLVIHGPGYYENVVAVSKAVADTESADPRLLLCTSLTHSSGHHAALHALLSRQPLVLTEGSDVGETLSLMGEQKITGMMVTPATLYEMLDHPDSHGGFPELRTIYYVGAGAAPDRLRAAMDRFSCRLWQFYASTECGVIAQLLPHEHEPGRPELLASCGRPAPGVAVEVRDEYGDVVRTGQIGEVHVRGSMVMREYWREPERTAEALRDGWLRTGDLAYRDHDGYLYLVDRVKDVIVTGRTADCVYSRLLDDLLISLPTVRDAAALGVPAPEFGESVHVVVVPYDESDLDTDELTRQVVDALGSHYAPGSYSVAASLPHTASGKVDKEALRASLPPRPE